MGMVVALIGKVLVVVATFQTQMARRGTLKEKPIDPAMKPKSQMLKAAPTLQNLMMKF